MKRFSKAFAAGVNSPRRPLFSVLLFLLAALACAGSASAQTETPPAQGPSAAELAPANPARAWFENRRILVEAGSGTDQSRPQYRFGRHFGHRIGDIVPVEVRIYVLPPSSPQDAEVQLDFDALAQGSLTLERQQDPDFELVRLPGQDGKPGPWVTISAAQEKVSLKRDETTTVTVYTISMLVRTFRPQPALPLTIQFACATQKRPDGKVWDWKPITSPAFVITRSPTADNGTDLLAGDTSPQEQAALLLPYLLIFFGGTLLCLPLTLIALYWLRRLFPPRVPDPEEAAWSEIDSALTAAGQSGFRQDHARRILVAIKRYAKVESLTAGEVEARSSEFFDGARLAAILTRLEVDVLYRGVDPSSIDSNKLRQDIEQLIPRP